MLGLGGVRGRLTATVVALVVITALVLGLGAYAFVDVSVHDRFVRDAEVQARFDLTTLIPARLEEPSTAALERSGLVEAFRARAIDLVADFGDVQPSFTSILSPAFSQAVADGNLAYQWTTLSTDEPRPRLVIGGRLPGTNATFYFLHDATAVENALAQLRLGLAGGAVLLVLLALLAARAVARGVLAPVEAAGRAAERIERGDLGARVPVTSRDEFGTWAERFNRMAAALGETIGRLEAAQAQNRQFVADVSHELRTPLTALVAEASILREHLDELPPGARRTGELLVADVGRLRELVEDLMELSRFDSAAEEAGREPVDLARLARQVAAARLPEARLEIPADPVVVQTDPRRIERILGNLLDNARQHAPGAPVEIRLVPAPGGGAVVLSVADSGPGLPAGRLDRIFDRFYKADPSRGRGGSGLGLAIAAENASLLGGSLTASNRPEGGLRFELRLPVTEPLPGGDPAATRGLESGAQTPTQEPVR
ncbi:MAG TPA: HAMP domain-containing sensor histidine kinase [Candidatus Limnocylindrales bacterium]